MVNPLVSPGINISEIDKAATLAPVSTAIGVFVGNFRWGPVEEVTSASSEKNLVAQFASPDNATSKDFHTATSFLAYSRNLKVVRAVTSAAKNANGGGDSSTVVKNDTHYDSQSFTFANQGQWIARFPGNFGNSLKVSLFGFKTNTATTQTNFDSWEYSNRFDGPVGTSAYAQKFSASNDEVHVAVVDEDGLFTGTPGTVLETFSYLSQASDALTDDGKNNYFVDVINSESKYIRFGGHNDTDMANAGTAASTGNDYALTPSSGVIAVSLTAGADSGALTASEYATGWDLFEDADSVEVSYLIAPDLPEASKTTIANDLISIAEARKDCVAYISPAEGDNTKQEILDFFNGTTASTYKFQTSGRVIVYDKYNDKLINIPDSGKIAGIRSEVTRNEGVWSSLAGARKGQLRGVTRLAYNPSQTDRDALYKANINPVITKPGRGTYLFGDKTGASRPGAFDRENVRGLFILLRKSIGEFSENVLFENNNVFTRSEFVAAVTPLLRTIYGRGGIGTDANGNPGYFVQCDEENNTADIIDAHQFVADIYVIPPQSINFIQLNLIASRSGAEFTEITGAI